jgi:predicted dehydrogenase
MSKMKVGIIGCGNISAAYMKNIPNYAHLELVACADIDVSKAEARAEEFGIAHAYTVEQLLGDPQVDIVINLTIPAVHAAVCIQILEAGKHAYVEKPLAVTREEGLQILEVAKRKGLSDWQCARYVPWWRYPNLREIDSGWVDWYTDCCYGFHDGERA